MTMEQIARVMSNVLTTTIRDLAVAGVPPKEILEQGRDYLVSLGYTPRAAANLMRLAAEAVRVENGLPRAYTDAEINEIRALAV